MNMVMDEKMKKMMVLGMSLLAAGLLGGCAILRGVGTPVTRVAVYLDRGARNCGAFCHLRIATFAENVEGFPVDAEMIRAGALDGADVLVMPGGVAITESKTLGEGGRQKVAEFIRNGGGYIGTCAGCFLVSEKTKSHPNMMGIIPYRSDICRGGADVRIKFNADAKKLAGIPAGAHRVDYHGGPVLEAGSPVEWADFKVIATYASNFQTASPEKRPSMSGKAAIVVGTYGKGRIFASAVHPEKDVDDHYILEGAFRYVTNGRVTKWQLPRRQRGQLSVGLVCGGSLGVETAKFLQRLLREGEFDLTPINSAFIDVHSLKDFDALLIPDAAEPCSTFKNGTHCTAKLKEFLARGGRVFTWGKAAESCFRYGISPCADAGSAVAAMRAFAAEPLPEFGDVRAKKIDRPVRAAIYTDNGGANTIIAEALEFSPEYELDVVSAEDVRRGALKNYDLYIQPGGGCHTQYMNLNEKGVAAVTNFIYGGGSYYGICAGAYMASQATNPKKKPRAGFVPYKHDAAPYRGWGETKMKMTEEGLKVFGNALTNRYVMYWGGPVLVPGNPVPDTDIKVLGEYVGNEMSLCSSEGRKPMNGKASFLGGRVGKGKAFISAPHPEKQSRTFDMVCSGLKFLTGKAPHRIERHRMRGALRVGFDPGTNGEATKFFVKRLAHDSRFDAKTKAWMEDPNLVRHLDAMVLAKPSGKPLAGAYGEFVKAGRPVFVVASNAKHRELAAKMPGVTALNSYDEVIPALEKLLNDGNQGL